MNLVGVVVCLVAFGMIVPITLPAGVPYLLVLLKFRGWFALAAMGWVFGIFYICRRGFEFVLRTPGGRTKLRERQG